MSRTEKQTDQNVLFRQITEIISQAKRKAYQSSNTILLQMYWRIGQLIVEDEQNGSAKATYGKAVLKNLAQQLTFGFGKGFDERNLNNMRSFYNAFPIWNAVRTELSWTHYRIISRLETEGLRMKYIKHAAEGGWDTRNLQRNITSKYAFVMLNLFCFAATSWSASQPAPLKNGGIERVING
jgi:predicted nuclease of restriction endonuclease-like (RecB) superfamily